ncbi:unnamed protein product [Urochloa humidicola]
MAQACEPCFNCFQVALSCRVVQTDSVQWTLSQVCYPLSFTAVGTAIVSTHSCRDPSGDCSVPDGFLPIVDVQWRDVSFGPGQAYYHTPIYLPVGGDAVFALDASTFSHLSLAP